MPDIVWIDDQNRATVTCPACKKKKTTALSNLPEKGSQPQIRCRCGCGHRFTAILERRTSPRKELNLSGKYICVAGEKRGLIRIRNLSRSGVGVELVGQPRFRCGDRLVLEFELDDANRSIVRREVRVLNLDGKQFNARFTTDEHYDELGPYLYYNGLSRKEEESEPDEETGGYPWREFFENSQHCPSFPYRPKS